MCRINWHGVGPLHPFRLNISVRKHTDTDSQWVKWNWFIHLRLHMELQNWNDLKWIEVTGAATEIEPREAERDADCHKRNVSEHKMSSRSWNQIYTHIHKQDHNLKFDFLLCKVFDGKLHYNHHVKLFEINSFFNFLFPPLRLVGVNVAINH